MNSLSSQKYYSNITPQKCNIVSRQGYVVDSRKGILLKERLLDETCIANSFLKENPWSTIRIGTQSYLKYVITVLTKYRTSSIVLYIYLYIYRVVIFEVLSVKIKKVIHNVVKRREWIG